MRDTHLLSSRAWGQGWRRVAGQQLHRQLLQEVQKKATLGEDPAESSGATAGSKGLPGEVSICAHCSSRVRMSPPRGHLAADTDSSSNTGGKRSQVPRTTTVD